MSKKEREKVGLLYSFARPSGVNKLPGLLQVTVALALANLGGVQGGAGRTYHLEHSAAQR